MPTPKPDHAERQIEVPRAAGHIADDERHHDAETRAADAIERLHRDHHSWDWRSWRISRRAAATRRTRGSARCRRPRASANRPTAGEASATMICGNTMQAAINKLGLPTRAVMVPLTSISIGALAKVNSMAQAQKINMRRSDNTLRKSGAAHALLGRTVTRWRVLAIATLRSGQSAASAGSVNAAVR